MEKGKYIGLLLEFDEATFNLYLINLEKNILPAIRELAVAYEVLELGPFSQQIFDRITSSGSIASIVQAYHNAVQADIKRAKITTPAFKQAALNRVKTDTDPIEEKRRSMQVAFDSFANSNAGYWFKLTWKDVMIVDGRPVYDKEKIKTLFETRITTEEQSKALELVENVESAWNEFKNYLTELGYDLSDWTISGQNGFFMEGLHGKLIIDKMKLVGKWFSSEKEATVNELQEVETEKNKSSNERLN